jgi:hypothetical protein
VFTPGQLPRHRDVNRPPRRAGAIDVSRWTRWAVGENHPSIEETIMTSASQSRASGVAVHRSTIQTVAAAVGAVFLLVGIMGFIPGITTNFDELTFAGHESGALLLGIFQVSILHNIVHLLFGVAGLAMARRADLSRLFLIGGGAVYLVLWLYGMVIDHGTAANFVPVNDADNWLHLGLGIGMIGLGLALTPRGTRTGTGRGAV